MSSVRTPEFPPGADLPPDGITRREMGELSAVAALSAALAGCIHSPTERILPYTRHPGPIVPGLPLFYATSMVLDGYATGLVVRAREGRPIKIEGNPEHPASLGATGAIEQASLLELYDPRRARGLRRGDQPIAWGDLRRRFGAEEDRAPQREDGGAGLAFLLESASSPLRRRLVSRIQARFPAARFYVHAAGTSRAPLDAARQVLGAALVPQYDLRAAERVLAVGADFAAEGPFHLRYARHFADTRRISSPIETLSRLYVVESWPTPTGSLADERLRARPSEQARVLAAVAAELGATGAALRAASERLDERQRTFAATAARDLAEHRGRALVIAGGHLDAPAHALAAWINQTLGSVGQVVWYTESALFARGTPSADLARLTRDIDAGAIDTLVIAGGNPVATAPADVPFGELLGRVEESVYLMPYENETAARARWVIARAHWLESWGDARAYDGTVSLVQPLIAPLFGGRTDDELLAVFAGGPERSTHSLLRELWMGGRDDPGAAEIGPGDAAVVFWERALERGMVAGTALARHAPPVSEAALLRLVEDLARGTEPPGFEVALRPDPLLRDGSFAGNAWLRELPDPTTKLTWGNAVLLSSATANEHGVVTGGVVEVEASGRTVRGPAYVVPGHADSALTLHLGHGRASEPEPAAAYGFDAYPLRTTAEPFLRRGATLRVLAPDQLSRAERARHRLATTQQHWTLDGREIALSQTLEEFRQAPDFTEHHRGTLPTLYQGATIDAHPPERAREQWAMTIDLSVCSGCNACVVACQAENNIPVVGPEGVRRGREMHWLRIDRYYAGCAADPAVLNQPMLCQHCERAPCEYVCPVFATAHSADGLNEMVYNRCVGTRFCSNNCPYKVRRFNWFDYSAGTDEVEALRYNPEVTVRERGVMEKCTYCVQRIRARQIQAELEGGRSIEDGEVTTACAQACPSRAILFGSLTDPESEVARSRENPRMYAVLHELHTAPRTRYLTRVTNPHPELSGRGERSGSRYDRDAGRILPGGRDPMPPRSGGVSRAGAADGGEPG